MNILAEDEKWLKHALHLAAYAESQGEVPIGAVIVTKEGVLVAEGWNQPITSHDPTAHAEIVALRNAAKVIQNYRLLETTLYVTLEPCFMCTGALMHARVQRLVYGASDKKMGCIKNRPYFLEGLPFNHSIICQEGEGILRVECQQILENFFKNKRSKE